ncbi:MAG: LPS-assembly protein LptD [Verrucomicrobiae bacterium]|nr:LPS-assembly protein LptD [Verrucomicrobiae bacterium]
MLCVASGISTNAIAQDESVSRRERGGSAKQNLDIQADFSDYDQNLGIAKAYGDVLVKYGDVTIQADQIEFHQSSGNIFARDNVRIFKDGQVVDAEEIIYNINTGEMTTSNLKSALEPIYYSSNDVQRPEEGTEGPITMLDSYFTTHDSATPNYHIKVKKLEVYPDDKIIMHGAKLYMGNTPVFWFPYFVQPMDAELGYYFTPGWNSAWGGFLLNRYGFMIGENHHAQAHLDFRSERGLAGGVEFFDRKFKNNDNIGRLNLYYASDNEPTLSFNGRDRRDKTSSDRYRINFQHRVYLPGSDDETFYLDFDINKLSDAFLYEDFFPSEFRIDPKPDNVVNLNKLFEQGEISLTGRFQLNEFFQTDTRSPELAIDIIRTPIGDTGFFYDGLTSYGLIDEELDDDSILAGMVDPSGFNRFHSYHEFLFPIQLGGILNVVPRAGAGYTNYSSFDIPGLGSLDRTTLHAGVDFSFKMSKKSPEIVNRALGINGLLHVVRPYMNFSYVSTDDLTGRFSPIDRFTPTTRLRPIDMPLFTSLDDIRDWQIIRSGVSNRWYTKRNGASYEWLALNNYFDTYLEDPEFNRDFSNFFTDVEWRPLPWLTASTTTQLPLFDGAMDFTELSSSVTFMPTDWFEIGIRHYFINDHPFFQDSDLYTLATYTRLSDNWGFSTEHRYESDDGTLEYQQYSIHRDLASWTASLGGIIRDNRDRENEYGVILSLTLKAFPKVSLPVDFQPGSLGAED